MDEAHMALVRCTRTGVPAVSSNSSTNLSILVIEEWPRRDNLSVPFSFSFLLGAAAAKVFARGLPGTASLNFVCPEIGEVGEERGKLFPGGTGVSLVPLPRVASMSAVMLKIGSCTGVTASDRAPDVPGRKPSRLPVTGRAAPFMPSRSDSPVSANDTAVVGLEVNIPACSRVFSSRAL